MSAQNSSFLARLGGLLIRVIFVIVLGIGLGAGAYFGVTALYSQFVQPVQEHNLRLNALEENFEETSQRQSRRMEELATRLDTLESQGDTRKETLADLQSRLENLEDTQSEQATLVASAVEAVNNLQADMADLQSETENIQGNLDTLEAQVQAMETDLAAAGDSIDNIIDQAGENAENLEALITLVEQETVRWETMQHELQVLRVMALISRSRFSLSQNNLSLAQADMRAGRDLLLNLENQLRGDQAELIVSAVERLEAALEDLPQRPVSAADELEGAWQLLIQGLPAPPTPTATSSPTVMPTDTVITLTPTTTPQP